MTARAVLKSLHSFGFDIVATRGSHAKLQRQIETGQRQTLTVPLHNELAPGTLRAIFRQASRFIPEEELRPHFYVGD